jgi:P pilus assembly chaperone PapD
MSGATTMYPMTQTRRGLMALAIAALAAIPAVASAQVGADLNLSPKRLVFGPSLRSATVYVFNQGDAPATYSVALVDRAMLTDGAIQPVEDALKDPAKAAVAGKVKSAREMITFTPRRVTLAGKSSQLVRLRVLRPADLPAGEYRTHLTVTAVPPEDTGVTAEQAAAGEQPGALAVRITALFSISIPLIVRQGPVDVRAGIENPQFQVRDAAPGDGGPARPTAFVSVDLTRLGASSVFGDVEVRGGPKNEVVGLIRGLAVYPEIDRRRVTIPLQTVPAHGTALTVTLRDDDTQPGVILATGRLAVP